ncbi:MAG: hypothetical protein SF123_16945 [Chloroflexota bacterium]|nr:hypothetical protein [Chloroflexota bacterium]
MEFVLFIVYGVAFITGYRIASRLAPNSLLHTTALTLFIGIINLILPPTYLGMVHLLRAEWLLVGGGIFWAAQWWLAGKLKPLPELSVNMSDSGLRLRAKHVWMIRRFGYLTCAALFVVVLLRTFAVASTDGTVSDVDAAWHYFPAVINMVQAGTLHTFQSFMPYFPLAFEMLHVWELSFTHTYLLPGVFHILIFAASLLYSALLMRLLLRDRPAFVRDIASFALLYLLMPMSISHILLTGTGKNDILLVLASLAGVYYLLCYWQSSMDQRLLIGVGTACGLLMSTKLVAVTWLAIFAAAHLVSLQQRKTMNLPTIRQDLFTVLIPFLLLVLPWGARLLFYNPFSAANASMSSDGFRNTIVRLWQDPRLTLVMSLQMTEILVIAGGFLLIMVGWFARRQPILLRLGSVILFIGLFLLGANPVVPFSLGLYLVLMIVTGALLLMWLRNRDFLPPQVAATAGIVLASIVLFAFVPFSVWLHEITFPNERAIWSVSYRFTTGSIYLFMIVTVGWLAHLLSPKTHNSDMPLLVGRSQRSRWAAAVIPAMLLLMVGYYTQFDLRIVRERYSSFYGRYSPPTSFYGWFQDNIANASIYSINAPPLLLYGRDFSNTVYYVTEGHSGYYGDQAYRWANVQALIDDKQLQYIVISFSYEEMQQAGLPPTPEVMAEIDLMRRNLEVIYEDEQITMFATPYANPDTVLQFEAR